MIELRLESTNQISHARRGQHLRGMKRNRTRRKYREIRHIRHRQNGSIRDAIITAQYRAQSNIGLEMKNLRDAAAPHISFNQQNARTMLGQHDGEIHAGSGLALLRQRAGHHQNFCRLAGPRKQYRGSQSAISFGNLRLRADCRNHRRRRTRQPFRRRQRFVGTRREWNHGQRRQSRDHPHLFQRVNRGVARLQNEGQRQSAREAHHQRHQKIAGNVG